MIIIYDILPHLICNVDYNWVLQS